MYYWSHKNIYKAQIFVSRFQGISGGRHVCASGPGPRRGVRRIQSTGRGEYNEPGINLNQVQFLL